MKRKLFALGFLFFLVFKVFSQQNTDSTQMWQIATNDGNNFIGFILDESPHELKFKTFSYGIVVIPKIIIVSQKGLNSTKERKKDGDKPLQPILPDAETLWRIVTYDGFDFMGNIVSKSEKRVELKTEKFGTINIHRSTIKIMDIVNPEQIVSGELWVENPQATRYFWAPNGYGLKKGEGYYQNVWVLFNQASYGFSEYFSFGAGVLPLFLFAGAPTPIWMVPKVSIPIVKDKINIGAGILAGTIIGESNSNFGIPYGVATLGDKNKNITFGLGYGYAGSDWADNPAITLSAMVRMGKRGYFITENYYISAGDESVTLISFGGRTVWSRSSFDYGLIIPISKEMNEFVAIPWLGFVIPFGN